MSDLISRQTAIDDIETVNPSMPLNINWVKNWVKTLPSAQPELIERTAYIRGFEQGKTQGMIDSQAEHTKKGEKTMIKAEWTNADALNLQPTCNQLATDCIRRQDAIRWVKTECNPYGNPTLDFESGKKVIEHLKQMPSAQPVIRCKDCKHFGGGTYCYERDDMWDENDFCSYAERKEQDDG